MSLTINLPRTAALSWLVYFTEDERRRLEDERLYAQVNQQLDQRLAGEVRAAWKSWREQQHKGVNIFRRETMSEPSQPLLPTSDFGRAEQARREGATHVAMVMANDWLDSPRPGFWASLTAARIVADMMSGVVIDPHRWVGHSIASLGDSPPPDGVLSFRTWFGVIACPSLAADCLDLRTSALERWGLPNLVLPDVPGDCALQATVALDGIAWALAERARRHAGRRVRWKELTVYEGHVAQAMGKPGWPTKSGSRVRLGMTMRREAGAEPEILLHHIRSPLGDSTSFARAISDALGGPRQEPAVA